jgi:hypothetical protein
LNYREILVDLLADEPVVVGMASDPEPMHPAIDRHPERSTVQTHADAVHSFAGNLLELKRGVRGIASQECVVSSASA